MSWQSGGGWREQPKLRPAAKNQSAWPRRADDGSAKRTWSDRSGDYAHHGAAPETSAAGRSTPSAAGGQPTQAGWKRRREAALRGAAERQASADHADQGGRAEWGEGEEDGWHEGSGGDASWGESSWYAEGSGGSGSWGAAGASAGSSGWGDPSRRAPSQPSQLPPPPEAPRQAAPARHWTTQPSGKTGWSGAPSVPEQGRSKTPQRAARLPEELGFDVSRGVRQKGYEIGQMEDGISAAQDGEPDVFLSHSYSDNCRRVDMAAFECDCPNPLQCCSHAYAALVALPNYRHRAAVLWAARQELGSGAAAGWARMRDAVKASLLQRIPLDELADASIEAVLGLQSRFRRTCT